MTVRELRDKYVGFFESKGHTRYPSGSLIPYDVTGRLDESLLFNGAGMIQFKPYFRGVAQPSNKRLTTVQKCVRTGDIDEVGDATHLTFFEMLGNFSFGDYFKVEAIKFSWEFLTSSEWLNLDPNRLSFTVFEIDDEAESTWKECGAHHVFRLGEDTNYWPAGAFSNGPPGPCGPNSEMFYWVPADEPAPQQPYTVEEWLRDESAGKWVEIWNDVFITYEWQGDQNPSGKGYTKTGMPELPFRSIDTGMGLERTAFVLGGYRTVYDTDAFAPIFVRIAGAQKVVAAPSPEVTAAKRIIADHIRTATFCIADGILPANNGRGYVLRRLIRRAILKGERVLGIKEAFMAEMYEGVVEAMGSAYAEIVERRDVIVETLRNEEALFRRTLATGVELLNEALEGSGSVLVGDMAFKLYDTFGFPLEVTQELCAERGVEVDLPGYEAAMKEAQERSRGAQNLESVYGGVTASADIALPDAPAETTFLGYQSVESMARIVRQRTAKGRVSVALDRTPFYAESGGQTGDTGWLETPNGEFTVRNTTKSEGTFWHELELDPAEAPRLLGEQARAMVDADRRRRIQRNHTATHLLQAALRDTLGAHVTQAGSSVGPDSLRFDFTHGKAMTEAEIATIEEIVNRELLRNTDVVTYADLPIAEAKAKGAMALFGEKYGDKVRMVEIGDFSRELCGGIHVRTTGEIGQFRIVSEASAASGIRRIEAITGESALERAREDAQKLKEAAAMLKVQAKELLPGIERALDQLKQERKRREQAELAQLQGGEDTASTVEIGGIVLWRKNLGDIDPKMANTLVDNEAAGKPNQVTLAAISTPEKVMFVCRVGAEAISKGAHAGNLIKGVAAIAGGGGGGKAEYASAGGKDPSKAEEALAAAEELLRAAVS